MSGRYRIDSNSGGMAEYFTQNSGVEMKTGDIFPSDIVPVIAFTEEGIRPQPMIWGFLKWTGKGLVYNARQESAHSDKLVAKSLMRRRAAVPATGFYEWKTDAYTGEKNKYLFTAGGSLFFAGCYQSFSDRVFALKRRFTVLTTNANAGMRAYHDRMPVLLRNEEIGEWLSGEHMEYYLTRDQFAVEPRLVMANSGEEAMNSL